MRRAFAAVLLFVLMIGAAAPAAHASTPASSPAAAVPDAAPPPGWSPWDGNHITTEAKCLSRRSFISKTYKIKLGDLRCIYFDACPTGYWVLYVWDGAAPPEFTGESARVKAPAVALC
jgi:hypothetical protein